VLGNASVSRSPPPAALRKIADIFTFDYGAAIPVLEKLRDKFGVATDEASLRADERFGALVGSAEFAAWIARSK
jgi:hypothetical protein